MFQRSPVEDLLSRKSPNSNDWESRFEALIMAREMHKTVLDFVRIVELFSDFGTETIDRIDNLNIDMLAHRIGLNIPPSLHISRKTETTFKSLVADRGLNERHELFGNRTRPIRFWLTPCVYISKNRHRIWRGYHRPEDTP